MSVNEYRTRSVKYVSGENTASTSPHGGICSSGIKIPEMKTSGNLISDESIMMFDGTFVGGTASSIPIAEKQTRQGGWRSAA